ncbi:energy transducer TonB [Ichthyenterobacterium magnum]|uniref:TonB-like protein n=1 Tax=Ichthyenterobacterium magnum TaxID=1230530 RepID=A0A420DW78_9FLAO|nr:energy transducer TonB [Ichthyenterobacterium magnum]RKE98469.1 TonB-like protein [Ichthyenterobacterium magnum]
MNRYMYQKRITELHEFIVDEKAVKHESKTEYYESLLTQIFETKQFSFVNPFFKQSLIKKRILMLNRSESKQTHLIKYTLLLPLVFGMLIYTSCEKEAYAESINNQSQYTYTLKAGNMIDAATKEVCNRFEAFLNNNPKYVGWAELNRITDEMTYSVHSIDEKVPNGYNEIEINTNNGLSYTLYMNLEEVREQDKKVNSKETLNELIEVVEDAGVSFDNVEVPIAVVDESPTFSFCKNETNERKKVCLTENIAKHVNKNFNLDLAKTLGLEGRQRISVIFKIDTNGKVFGIRARAPHPELEKEAIRVIQTLPTFISGKHKGKAVVVPYSLPILFQVH